MKKRIEITDIRTTKPFTLQTAKSFIRYNFIKSFNYNYCLSKLKALNSAINLQ